MYVKKVTFSLSLPGVSLILPDVPLILIPCPKYLSTEKSFNFIPNQMRKGLLTLVVTWQLVLFIMVFRSSQEGAS